MSLKEFLPICKLGNLYKNSLRIPSY